MISKAANVRAIGRAIDVLECFAETAAPLSITEIERRVRLSRPTLYRILTTLIERGLVRKDGEPIRYRLDVGIGRLADAWSNSLDIVNLTSPLLRDLLDQFDETVALYVRKGNSRICAVEMPSRQPLSYVRGLGYSGSLVRGASGLAILAYLDSDEAARIIAQERDSARGRTIQRKLPKIRRDGYVVSQGDFIAGATAIASPVFDRRAAVVASLGLFGPSVRFPARRVRDCAKAVKASAASLSSLLGRQLNRSS